MRKASDVLRVLHVLEPEPDGEVGGADLHVLDLATAQKARAEVEPYVVINQSSDFATRLTERDILFFPGHRYRDRLFRFAKRVSNLPYMKDVDIVHGHGYESNYLIAILKTIYPRVWGKLPVVMTCHGWVETLLKHRFKTALDIWTYHFASALIVCARNQLPRVTKSGYRHVVYIPNGVILRNADGAAVHVGKLSTMRSGGNKIVGFVGRLAPEKRVDSIIRIFSLVSQIVPESHLVIIGSGPLKDKLVQKSCDLRLNDRIHFWGHVTNAGPLYPFFDVLVQASETEGTSRVIAEAMLSGVPVVATKVGGLVDMIDHGKDGFLFSLEDIKSYQEILVRLLQDQELRSEVGIAAKLRAEQKFTIEAMERAVANVYRDVLNVQSSRKATSSSVDSEKLTCEILQS
jgi:glycosyltransferase involved in cell wall biosynthesis